MIRGEHGIQCMPCSSQTVSEMLPEIHTMAKFDFSQIYLKHLILCYICLDTNQTSCTICHLCDSFMLHLLSGNMDLSKFKAEHF